MTFATTGQSFAGFLRGSREVMTGQALPMTDTLRILHASDWPAGRAEAWRNAGPVPVPRARRFRRHLG